MFSSEDCFSTKDSFSIENDFPLASFNIDEIHQKIANLDEVVCEVQKLSNEKKCLVKTIKQFSMKCKQKDLESKSDKARIFELIKENTSLKNDLLDTISCRDKLKNKYDEDTKKNQTSLQNVEKIKKEQTLKIQELKSLIKRKESEFQLEKKSLNCQISDLEKINENLKQKNKQFKDANCVTASNGCDISTKINPNQLPNSIDLPIISEESEDCKKSQNKKLENVSIFIQTEKLLTYSKCLQTNFKSTMCDKSIQTETHKTIVNSKSKNVKPVTTSKKSKCLNKEMLVIENGILETDKQIKNNDNLLEKSSNNFKKETSPFFPDLSDDEETNEHNVKKSKDKSLEDIFNEFINIIPPLTEIDNFSKDTCCLVCLSKIDSKILDNVVSEPRKISYTETSTQSNITFHDIDKMVNRLNKTNAKVQLNTRSIQTEKYVASSIHCQTESQHINNASQTENDQSNKTCQTEKVYTDNSYCQTDSMYSNETPRSTEQFLNRNAENNILKVNGFSSQLVENDNENSFILLKTGIVPHLYQVVGENSSSRNKNLEKQIEDLKKDVQQLKNKSKILDSINDAELEIVELKKKTQRANSLNKSKIMNDEQIRAGIEDRLNLLTKNANCLLDDTIHTFNQTNNLNDEYECNENKQLNLEEFTTFKTTNNFFDTNYFDEDQKTTLENNSNEIVNKIQLNESNSCLIGNDHEMFEGFVISNEPCKNMLKELKNNLRMKKDLYQNYILNTIDRRSIQLNNISSSRNHKKEYENVSKKRKQNENEEIQNKKIKFESVLNDSIKTRLRSNKSYMSILSASSINSIHTNLNKNIYFESNKQLVTIKTQGTDRKRRKSIFIPTSNLILIKPAKIKREVCNDSNNPPASKQQVSDSSKNSLICENNLIEVKNEQHSDLDSSCVQILKSNESFENGRHHENDNQKTRNRRKSIFIENFNVMNNKKKYIQVENRKHELRNRRKSIFMKNIVSEKLDDKTELNLNISEKNNHMVIPKNETQNHENDTNYIKQLLSETPISKQCSILSNRINDLETCDFSDDDNLFIDETDQNCNDIDEEIKKVENNQETLNKTKSCQQNIQDLFVTENANNLNPDQILIIPKETTKTEFNRYKIKAQQKIEKEQKYLDLLEKFNCDLKQQVTINQDLNNSSINCEQKSNNCLTNTTITTTSVDLETIQNLSGNYLENNLKNSKNNLNIFNFSQPAMTPSSSYKNGNFYDPIKNNLSLDKEFSKNHFKNYIDYDQIIDEPILSEHLKASYKQFLNEETFNKKNIANIALKLSQLTEKQCVKLIVNSISNLTSTVPYKYRNTFYDGSIPTTVANKKIICLVCYLASEVFLNNDLKNQISESNSEMFDDGNPLKKSKNNFILSVLDMIETCLLYHSLNVIQVHNYSRIFICLCLINNTPDFARTMLYKAIFYMDDKSCTLAYIFLTAMPNLLPNCRLKENSFDSEQLSTSSSQSVLNDIQKSNCNETIPIISNFSFYQTIENNKEVENTNLVEEKQETKVNYLSEYISLFFRKLRKKIAKNKIKKDSDDVDNKINEKFNAHHYYYADIKDLVYNEFGYEHSKFQCIRQLGNTLMIDFKTKFDDNELILTILLLCANEELRYVYSVIIENYLFQYIDEILNELIELDRNNVVKNDLDVGNLNKFMCKIIFLLDRVLIILKAHQNKDCVNQIHEKIGKIKKHLSLFKNITQQQINRIYNYITGKISKKRKKKNRLLKRSNNLYNTR